MARELRKYLKRRTEARFERLVRGTYVMVVRAAERALTDRSAAEDVAQEVYLGLLRNPPEPELVRSDAGWLCARAIGLARTHQRGATRRAVREERKGEQAMHNPLSTDDTDAIHHAVAALPDSLRQCVELAYFGELPAREIAALLDVTPRAVDKRLQSARSTLERTLAPSVVRAVAFGPPPTMPGVRRRVVNTPPESTVQRLVALAHKENLLAAPPAPSFPLVAASLSVVCALAAGIALWSRDSTPASSPAPDDSAVVADANRDAAHPTLVGAPPHPSLIGAPGDRATDSQTPPETKTSTGSPVYAAHVHVVDEAGRLVRTGSVRLQPAGIAQQLRFMKLSFDPALKRFAWLLGEISLADRNPIRIENVPAALIGLEVDVLASVPGLAQPAPLRLRVEAGAAPRLRLSLREVESLVVSVVDRETRSPVAEAFIASKTEAARRGRSVQGAGNVVDALVDGRAWKDRPNAPGWSGLSDATGACTLSQLYPGVHEILVQKIGYRPVIAQAEDANTPLTVALQPIERPARVRVQLLAEDGRPVVGMPVAIQQTDAAYTLLSDDEGRVDFDGLAPVFSMISVDRSAWAKRMGKTGAVARMSKAVTLAPSASVTMTLGYARGAGVLSLSLRTSSGAPLVGLPVRASGGARAEATTDGNGDVVLRDLPVGPYRVSIGKRGQEWVLRNVAVDEAGARREIVVPQTRTTLTITSSEALSDYRPKRGYLFVKGAASAFLAWSGDRSVTLPALPVGSYSVEVREPSVLIGRARFEITVSAGAPVTIRVLRGASIAVSSTLARTGTQLTLHGDEGTTRDLTPTPSGAPTAWTASAVLPGRYELIQTNPDGTKRQTTLDLRNAVETRVDLDDTRPSWR